ncbi:hypothetical protein EX30DRAFT_394562 [Ascodesmis nigricans]|uniref:Snf7-domain-containing protein n=1 Tax=Ascodesmis nigricans TaxID=341454 RepID=A0A4S2N2E0_9PEZI|nr:hypothetical protein EX30DRAFT_394562 [Ascodesmis nigricans]
MAPDNTNDTNPLLSFILSLPDFRKPRLPSLYSDFRHLQTTNPNGYHANLTAWHTALTLATAAGLTSPASSPSTFILDSTPSLLNSLSLPEWGRPLGLGIVIDEAVKKRDMWELETFLRRRESVRTWSYMGAVVGWGLGVMGFGAAAGRKVVEGRFVVVGNVEEAAKKVVEMVAPRTTRAERVFTVELFKRELTPDMSSLDLQVLLKFLSRDLGAAAYDGATIKFPLPHEPLTPITTQDTSLAQLRTLLTTLRTRTTDLTTTITTLTNKTRAAVSTHNTLLAKSALRSRKLAETALETTLSSLSQLEAVMASIEQATDNLELVGMLEKSSGVLESLNREIGGTERVDGVMDRLREEMDVVDEVRGVLDEGAGVVDEGEVEDEIEEMLRVEREKERERREGVEVEMPVPVQTEEDERLANRLKELKLENGGNATSERERKRREEEQVPA